MSLSPRPERVTSTVENGGSSPVPAARITQAMACADSSAARMPSGARQPDHGGDHPQLF